MKFLVLIFTSFIFALSAKPCSDINNNCQDDIPIQTTEKHNHDEDTDDNCSPFCSCTCCGVQISIVEFKLIPVELKPFYELSNKILKIKKIEFPSSYFGEIWQPPQI